MSDVKILTLPSKLDSIAASLFVWNLLSWQIVSIRWQDPNNNTFNWDIQEYFGISRNIFVAKWVTVSFNWRRCNGEKPEWSSFVSNLVSLNTVWFLIKKGSMGQSSYVNNLAGRGELKIEVSSVWLWLWSIKDENQCCGGECGDFDKGIDLSPLLCRYYHLDVNQLGNQQKEDK